MSTTGEPGRETARDAPSRLRIRDTAYVWLGALLLGVVASGIAFGVTGGDVDDPSWVVTAVGAVVQYGAIGAGVVLVSVRRGSGSLRRDFGLVVRPRDWWAVPVGAGLAIALGLVLLPLQNFVDDEQDVVEALNDAEAAELAVLVGAAAVLAPLFEELLFRGLLLRGLRGRYSPRVAIAVSGLAFGLVHLLDFSLGTVIALPALVALGVFCAHHAVRTGELSRPILIHFGFNSVAVLGALAS